MYAAHADIPYLAVAPFVLILLGIAVLPLVAHEWWESNRNRLIFTAVITVPTAGYLFTLDWHMLLHAGEEYFSFIFLLAVAPILVTPSSSSREAAHKPKRPTQKDKAEDKEGHAMIEYLFAEVHAFADWVNLAGAWAWVACFSACVVLCHNAPPSSSLALWPFLSGANTSGTYKIEQIW